MSSSEQRAIVIGPGIVLDGRYRIGTLLGEGGMGLVYRATHLELEAPVAVKVLRPEYARDEQLVDRFLAEARTAASLRSDHVVRALDLGRLVSGSPYIVLELVDGPDLEQVLAARGPLSIEETLRHALDLCEGLVVAHGEGIVHRDVKPENLLLETLPGGATRLKILDFGIAKRSTTRRLKLATHPSITLGSPHYMAPEQLSDARDVDARADLWSLGVVLHEMLTGALPFLGDSWTEVSARVLGTEPPSARSLRLEVPVELDSLIRACLRKDRERRPPSAAQVVRILRHVQDGLRAPRPRATSAALATTLPDVPTKRRALLLHADEAPQREPGQALGRGLGMALAFGALLGLGAFVASHRATWLPQVERWIDEASPRPSAPIHDAPAREADVTRS